MVRMASVGPMANRLQVWPIARWFHRLWCGRIGHDSTEADGWIDKSAFHSQQSIMWIIEYFRHLQLTHYAGNSIELTLNASFSANIKISNDWPTWMGHPPWRSSGPQVLLTIWLRTMTLSLGRILKCKFLSSLGSSAAPVCILTTNLTKHHYYSLDIFPIKSLRKYVYI